MAQIGATIFASSLQMETNLNMADHIFVLVNGQIRHSISNTQVKTELETDKALN
jgi:ABC-type branched-subunit amino acid transport system ATPase component